MRRCFFASFREPACGPGTPLGRVALTGEGEAEQHHADAEAEMQPVVCAVDGQEVGAAALVHEQSVQPYCQVDQASPEEVGARRGIGAGQRDADDPGYQVQDVVQAGDGEYPEELRAGMVSGPFEEVVVGGHAWDEAQDTDHEEPARNQQCGRLHRHVFGGCRRHRLTPPTLIYAGEIPRATQG